MKRNVIYFVDEDDAARRANARELKALIANEEIVIKDQPPFENMQEFDALIKQPMTAAFILDQRMKGGGKANYNGIDLARHLRLLDGKMPIYILTGHSESIEDFAGAEHFVDDILAKSDIEIVDSHPATIVKARLLRHLEVFNDVRDEQEQRFHELLIESLQGELTAEERDELHTLEGEVAAPVIAAERGRERELDESIRALRDLLNSGKI